MEEGISSRKKGVVRKRVKCMDRRVTKKEQ